MMLLTYLDFLLSLGSLTAKMWTVPLSLEQQRKAESRLKLRLWKLQMELMKSQNTSYTCTIILTLHAQRDCICVEVGCGLTVN